MTWSRLRSCPDDNAQRRLCRNSGVSVREVERDREKLQAGLPLSAASKCHPSLQQLPGWREKQPGLSVPGKKRSLDPLRRTWIDETRSPCVAPSRARDFSLATERGTAAAVSKASARSERNQVWYPSVVALLREGWIPGSRVRSPMDVL